MTHETTNNSLYIFAYILILVFSFYLIYIGTKFPKKIDTAYNNTIVIEDNLEIIQDKEQLENCFEKFYKDTGITVSLVTISNDAINERFPNVDTFSSWYYMNSFQDDMHLLIVYSENDWNAIWGNGTYPLITSKISSKFDKSLENELGTASSFEDAVINAINSSLKTVLSPRINYLYYAFAIFFIISIFISIIIRRRK